MTDPRRTTLSDDDHAGRLYRKAARLISEKGFDETSMSEIAGSVDLTTGGLYYYVKGKKALLFAIESFALDLLDTHVVAPARKLEDAEERLRAIVREHARLLIREPGVFSLLIDQPGSLPGERREVLTARKRAFFDFVRETLETLRVEGRLRQVDPTTATSSLLGMIEGLLRRDLPGGWTAGEEVVADVVELALFGLARNDPGSDVAERPEGRLGPEVGSKWKQLARRYREQPCLTGGSEQLNEFVREFRDDFSI